jgi:thioredoxin-like negative regulator of GroEL
MVLLVEFYTNWCGHCRAVEPIVNEIATEHAGFVKVLRIDVDSEPGLSARFSVKGTPTFLLYKKGHLLGRIDGAPKAHRALRDWVLQALGA